MLITEDQNTATYHIQSYELGKSITINHTTYSNSIIIFPQRLVIDWAPKQLNKLQTRHLTPLFQYPAKIIILGTGKHFIMPSQAQRNALEATHAGLEYMSTAAACRTYSALSAEGRDVVAALLIQ